MLLGDFARVAALHSIGLLVIDEIQHLDRSKSGVSEKILRFFVQLTNTIKLPILFVGTPKAYELFSPSMRSARRASQFGSINWSRFNTASRAGKNSEWDRFFDQLWSLQWFKSPQPMTENIRSLFWDYSQGIAHVAVTLFYLCQTRAVTIRREIIDKKLVDIVFNEELHMIRPMIRALQSGREEEIQKYADLEIPRSNLIQNSIVQSSSVEVFESQPTVIREDSKFDQLVNVLEQMGVGSDIAPALAEQAIEELPNGTLFDLVAHIRNLEEKEPLKREENKPKVVKLTPKYVENDLRLMVNSKGGSYKTMKQEGVIVNLLDYL